MQSNPDPDLETLIDAELKELPSVPAPARLASRVLSILEDRAASPWWRRTWWDWPLSAKAAFVLLSLAIVAAFSGGGIVFGNEFSTYSQLTADRLTFSGGLSDSVASLRNAVGLLWEKGQFLVIHTLILASVIYLGCLGLGTAVVRSALKQK